MKGPTLDCTDSLDLSKYIANFYCFITIANRENDSIVKVLKGRYL